METNNLYNHKNGFKIPEDYFENFDEKLSEKLTDSSIAIFSDTLKSGFDIPKNYFETFETNLFKNLAKDDEKPSVTFDNLKSGMTLPENYFEKLEASILENTTQSKDANKTISLFSKENILFISGIAAMITIIISIALQGNKDPLININTLELADIQEYFEGEDLYIDENISSLFDEKINLMIDTFNSSEVSDETLLDYLSDEEFESGTIYME